MSYRSHLSRSSYYGQRPHGYGSGYGWATGFTGVLDTLSSFPYSFWSFARRGTRRWRGPVGRLYRTSDGEELDIYGRGRWGLVDPREVKVFSGFNKLARTEEFTDAVWQSLVAGTGVTPTRSANAAMSPLGTLAADRVVLQTSTSTSSDRCGIRQTANVVNGVAETLSFWVRSNTTDSYTVAFHFSGSTQTLFDVTPEWTRVSFSGLANTTGSAFFGLEIRGPNCSTYADLLLFGAQLNPGLAIDTYEPRIASPAGNGLWTKLYDQTGAGRHFEQASNLIMPYACRQGVPVTENGIQSAEFVAADARRMVVSSSTGSFNFLHTTGGSVSSVSQANDTASQKVLLGNSTGDISQGFRLSRAATEDYFVQAGRIDVAGIATNGNSISRLGNFIATNTNTHLFSLLDPDNPTAANRLFSWQNGVAQSLENASAGMPFVENAGGNLTLGTTPAGGNPFDGTITEVAIWDSLIGSGDRGTLWSDASSLWGLA